MVFLRNAILILSMLFTFLPATVNAAGYSISIDTSPQTVDIRGTSQITLKITKGSSPVSNIQIFLGLKDITGQLKSQMVVTDKTGIASTVFIPQEPGTGYILAKATISDSGNIESLEAMAQIAVRDLNVEPTSFVDQIYPLPGRIGQPMTFIGHGSDTDGKVIKCQWSMGDGKTYENEGDSSKILHIYERTGTYLVNFSVTDNRNVSSKPVISKITVIDNKPPVGVISGAWPQRANINQEVVFEAKLTDPEEHLTGCRIDFGDGTGQTVEAFGKETVCAFRHKYTRPGTYSVFATPLDDQGSGDNFPIPSWQIIVEGEAKGGATLTIKGAIGKTINLLGPLPSLQVAFAATLGLETVETGMTMLEGQYRLVSYDRTFGFEMPDPIINITPYNTITVTTSIWSPTILVETAASHGRKWLNISLVDQNNRPIARKSTISVTTEDGLIDQVLQTSSGNATIALNPDLFFLKPTIKADFDYVSVSTQKTLQFPASLPDIRLKPVSSSGSQEILVTSNVSVTGQMHLTWKLWDRLMQTSIPVSRVIEFAPEDIYVSLIPYRLPVKVDKADPGRYLLTVDCQMIVLGTRISDSCQFDPCADKINMQASWGISPEGKIILKASVFDKLWQPISSQRLKLDYEMGRAIGWIPDKTVLSSLPKNARTNLSGSAWVELDLASVLKDLLVEDVKVTISTLTSGVTCSVTLSIPPPPKNYPVLQTWVIEDSPTTSTIKLKLIDMSGNAVAGKWIDISYSMGDSKLVQADLGFPPISIRTTHKGFATFTITKPRSGQLEIFFQTDIDGIPVTSIVKISKK